MVAADSGLAPRMRLMFSHLISFLARRYTSQGARAKHGKITNNTNLRLAGAYRNIRQDRAAFGSRVRLWKKLRELEHQFDAAAFSLREAYLGDVLRFAGPSRNYRPRPRVP